MLPTFVIGLREGLEAALIVGIIAAFLRKQGRRDLVRWVFAGVGVAVLLCLGVGIALRVVSQDLPQKQQEGLETVIGALAVVMVTYMVVWMRRHSRELKGTLEGLAADALAAGQRVGGRPGADRAARAMVLMAFLAVLREGFETVVFLLAAFNEAGSGGSAALGAVLGIAVAVVLGYGIYRGGVRINLSKFFRVTGLVLVLVAAGLVVNALHTAHEAGWLNSGQGSTIDLTWLVRPGSVQSSLLTGMLGVQTHPVVIEVVGWLVFLIPVGVYVAWPPGRTVSRVVLVRTLGAVAAVAAIVAGGLALSAPSRPSGGALSAGALSASVVSRSSDALVVRTRVQSPAGGTPGPTAAITLTSSGRARHAGIDTDAYTATRPGSAAAGQPSTLTVDRIAALNGGRLPIGLQVGTGAGLPVSYTDRSTLTVWVHPGSGRIVDLSWTERVNAAVVAPGIGRLALPQPVATGTRSLPPAVSTAAVAAAVHAGDQLATRRDRFWWAWCCAVVAGLALLGLLGLALRRRRPVPADVIEPTAAKALVVS